MSLLFDREAEAALMLKAPDPDAFGRIKSIVRSAHKWGGDGTRPSFRKIRRRLASKPQVLKAFGGSADRAAAWIKDNWYALHGLSPRGKTGSGPTYWRGKGKAQLGLDPDDLPLLLSWWEPVPDGFGEADAVLYCASDPAEESDGLVWKTIMRTGSWVLNPTRGARGPLTVDRPYLDEIKDAFDQNAWEHVTVPLSHRDKVDENTGYVRRLEIVEEGGVSKLKAGIEFTEKDVERKAKNGSIANCSVGVDFDVPRTEDGKVFKKVLKHVCLTNQPWLNRLDPFGKTAVAAEFPSYELDDEDDVHDELTESDLALLASLELARPAKPKFDESESFDAIRNKIADLVRSLKEDSDGEVAAATDGDYGNRLYPHGLTKDKVLICRDGATYGSGTATGWVAGYEVEDDGEVTLDPADEWERVQKTWIRLSQEFQFGDPQTFVRDVNETDMELGWLDGKAKRSNLADGDFAVVATVDGRKVRKLPYKVHGKVDSRGWKAAWNAINGARGGVDLPAGWSVERVKKVLLRNKPAEVTVQAERIRILGQTKGGAEVAGENETAETGADLTLSREQLDEIIGQRVREGIEAERTQAQERETRLQTELDRNRRSLHELRVRERVEELNREGYAPAVVTKAQELLLADDALEPALQLSREGQDVQLTVTAVVNELLEAFPKTALTASQVELPASADRPNDDTRDPVKDADEMYDQLFGPTAAPAVGVTEQ